MIDTCSVCASELLFSARQRGDGLCGPCSRFARGEETDADKLCRQHDHRKAAPQR